MHAADLPNILLVEDDESIATLERRCLEGIGLNIWEANLGQRALKYLEELQPLALVVLDYRLPDMTGADIVAEIGDRIHSLPVVVVTGYPDPEIEAQMRSAGVFDYIVKDMNLTFLDRLPQTVKAALEEPQKGVETVLSR